MIGSDADEDIGSITSKLDDPPPFKFEIAADLHEDIKFGDSYMDEYDEIDDSCGRFLDGEAFNAADDAPGDM